MSGRVDPVVERSHLELKRAVILAGGVGSRLAPYTLVFPKPLMPLGSTPILEIVIRQLAARGFDEVIVATGHLAELIETFFGNGEAFGISIRYVREQQPLGTAGALGLVTGLDEPFLVMNGDILTTLDYGVLIEEHASSGADMTIATHRREQLVDFGVIESDESLRVTGYVEKPRLHYNVSMGAYALSPGALNFIESGERIDIPELVGRLLHADRPVRIHPFEGFWLDIGRHDDFARAQEEFEKRKNELLGLGPA